MTVVHKLVFNVSEKVVHGSGKLTILLNKDNLIYH